MCIIYIKGSGGLQAELHKAISDETEKDIWEKVAKSTDRLYCKQSIKIHHQPVSSQRSSQMQADAAQIMSLMARIQANWLLSRRMTLSTLFNGSQPCFT